MASLNKVLLIGNLTRDPDVRMLSNGRPVCNFGLALNRNYKDAEGNRREKKLLLLMLNAMDPELRQLDDFSPKADLFLLKED